MAQFESPFRAFTFAPPGIIDRLITPVKIFPAFDSDTTDAASVPVFECNALWDTGASKSVISPAVVAALNLPPAGTITVTHAGGTEQRTRYMVNVSLPNNVNVEGVLVSDFAPQDGFDVLVGMDIITLGDFAVTHHEGTSCMSFRIPSCQRIDYVKEHWSILKRVVDRNDPCPCGAKHPDGKPIKFKYCHG